MIKLLASCMLIYGLSKGLEFQELKQERGVGELNDDNMQDFIMTNKYVLVLFFSIGCGHSQKALDNYHKIGEKLTEKNLKMPITIVDIDQSKEMASKYGIKSVPALKLFAKGHPISYASTSITPNVVFDWIESVLENKFSDELKSIEDIEEIKELNIAVLIYLPRDDLEQLEDFNFIGASFENIPFYYTYNDKIARQLNIDASYVFLILRKFDDGMKVFSSDGPISLAIMSDFMKMFSSPIIESLSSSVLEHHRSHMNIVLVYVSNDSKSKTYENFESVCFDRHNSVSCIFANKDLHETHQFTDDLGMHPEDESGLFLIHFKDPKREVFKLNQEFTTEKIDAFVIDFFKGNLNQFYKTQITDTSKEQEMVRSITSVQFDDLVINVSYNVLVLVTKPSCHECGEYKPLLQDLMLGYTHQGNFFIYKIDGSKNEHKYLNYETIPALLLYLKRDKTRPLEYKGKKSVESIKQFLSKSLKVKLRTMEENTEYRKKVEQAKAEGRPIEEDKFNDDEEKSGQNNKDTPGKHTSYDDAGTEL